MSRIYSSEKIGKNSWSNSADFDMWTTSGGHVVPEITPPPNTDFQVSPLICTDLRDDQKFGEKRGIPRIRGKWHGLFQESVLGVFFRESLVIRLYSEIDQIHLSIEAQCGSPLYLCPLGMFATITVISLITHLCPGEDYWAYFYNFLHMNPSDDQMKKYHIFGSPTPSFAYN